MSVSAACPWGRRPRGWRVEPARCWTGCMPEPFKISFLGGLGEIGRNCAVLETGGRMLLLDCGIMFPEVDMPGIDLVLPDFTYIRDNADRLEGIVLTHGHEDHVGGLAYL